MVRIHGAVQMSQRLKKFVEDFPKKAAIAIKEEYEIEKRESQKRTPKKTGDLRLSHAVLEPKITRKYVRVDLVVTMPYAVYVHENLEAFHSVGQAKFLESVIYESRKNMGARIARRIDISTSHF